MPTAPRERSHVAARAGIGASSNLETREDAATEEEDDEEDEECEYADEEVGAAVTNIHEQQASESVARLIESRGNANAPSTNERYSTICKGKWIKV